METKLIRVDVETASRLEDLADGSPVASYLRQHTRELIATKARGKMEQDLWHQVYDYTFGMKVKTEEEYHRFRSGFFALLVSAATMEQGKTTADHAVYELAINQLKNKPGIDEGLRRDLLEDLYKGDAALDMPEEEAEECSKAMYEELLERTIVQGEKKAMDVLLYMMKVIPEGSSEEKILKSVLRQPRWLQLVNEKLKEEGG